MKTKPIWIVGILLALALAGCRFVESTAEQQVLGDQASPASAGEAGTSLPQPSPPAASKEEESPAAPAAEAPEATEAPKVPSPGTGAGTTAPPAPGTPPQKAAETPETSPPAPSPTEPAEKGQGPTPPTPPSPAKAPQPSASRPGSTATSEAETPQPALQAEAEPETKPAPPPSAQQMKELAQQIAKAQAVAKALSEKEPTRELEEVPGGGAKPQSGPPATQKPEPPKPAPSAAAGPRSVEPPVREAKPAEPSKGSSERRLAAAPRSAIPERESGPAPEALGERGAEAEETPEQEALKAEQQAWEEAERARQAQRQAAFASIKRHLAQVEDALDGQKNGLQEALSALQRMRRSLGFLRSALTPVATWYHLDCALALLQGNQIDAAREQLDAALALIPVALPTEKEEAPPAPEGTTEADPEEPAAGQTARPSEQSASEGGTTDRTEGTERESPRDSAGPEPDLRARLIEWRDALQGDAPEETQRALEQLLAEAPASAEEELLDNLEAEIDYASEALGRGSRKAAEMELESIRENVDELAHLVLGEAPAGESQAETQEPAAGGEAAEGPKELSGDTGSTPPSSATQLPTPASPGTKRTSRLPAAALFGGLAIGLLVWGRTRRPRP